MNSSKRYSFVHGICVCTHCTCADSAFLTVACLSVRRPERWEAIPEAVKAIPGVFGNLMTFITGAHACIGYRFAVAE
jgi:hypothetical protein